MSRLCLDNFLQFLCILLNIVAITRQECLSFRNNLSRSCNSVDDLKTIGNVDHVVLYLSRDLPNSLYFDGISSENVVSIQRLEIKNSINSLNGDVFEKFTNLKYLILNYNKINTVPRNILNHQKLEYLSLSFGQIATISPDGFKGLPNLKNLRLDHNKLERIEFGIFNNLTIEILALSHNQIREIAANSFANSLNLTNLYLDGNRLKDFSSANLLNFPNKLKNLWLQTNYLNKLTRKTLENLQNLEVLNVAFNLITTIDSNTFNQTPKLKVLGLTHNSLTVINSNIFPVNGANIERLYLDHNRLMFLSSSVFIKLPKLKAITIGGNPWQCSCLDLIQIWLTDNHIKYNCDKDYFNGKLPVCVVPDMSSNQCKYSYEQQYYQLYNNTHSLYPPGKLCLL